MTIITSTTAPSASPMATAWTLTAQQICTDGLEHLSAIAAGETPSASDMNTAMRALDAVLKELPLVGYHWPKLSAETALTWDSGHAQTITLPADYYNYPVVRKTVNGETIPLAQIAHAEWSNKTGREDTAEQPTHYYISQSGVLYFWPAPTIDPLAILQYQRIVSDAAASSTPDMPQYWFNALGWGVAHELRMKFSVSPIDRQEISNTWREKRALALANAIPSEIISFSVAD